MSIFWLLMGAVVSSQAGALDSGGQPTGSCSDSLPSATSELHLREYTRYGAPGGEIPLALSASSESRIFAVDPRLRSVLLVQGNAQHRVLGLAGDTGWTVIAHGHARILVARAREVFQYLQDSDTFELVLTLDSAAGHIISLAEDDSVLWIVTRQDSMSALFALKRPIRQTASGIPTPLTIDGLYRLHVANAGLVIASRQSSPFTILLVDRRGGIRARYSPLDVIELLANADIQKRSIVSLAALPLDCGRLLQVLVDLRGESRWFIFIDMATGRPFRYRRLAGVPGLVQSLRGRRLLLGYESHSEGGEIVLYSWKWQ